MTKGLFITATGTDVGKTYVSGLLAKKLKDNSINVGYYKAALSGATRVDGSIVPGDALQVCKAGGIDFDPSQLVTYIYETPASPHLAATLENNPVDLETISRHFDKVKRNFDFILAEGSGGIVCPLKTEGDTVMLKDVIKLLNFEVIVVSRSGLGSINDAVLTCEYARSHKIGIAGIILNNYDDADFINRDNKLQIEKLTGVPVIACVKAGDKDIDIDFRLLKEKFKEV